MRPPQLEQRNDRRHSRSGGDVISPEWPQAQDRENVRAGPSSHGG